MHELIIYLFGTGDKAIVFCLNQNRQFIWQTNKERKKEEKIEWKEREEKQINELTNLTQLRICNQMKR